MRKRLECGSAMIVAHATRPDPAKWQMQRAKLHGAIVHAGIARLGLAEYAILQRLVLREDIQRERHRARIDPTQRIIQGVIPDHRQEWPKDFLLHDWAIKSNIGQHRRCDIAVVYIDLPTLHHPPRRHQAGQALGVSRADDAAIVLAVAGILTKKLPHGLAQRT